MTTKGIGCNAQFIPLPLHLFFGFLKILNRVQCIVRIPSSYFCGFFFTSLQMTT
jgi:hypothetical protein